MQKIDESFLESIGITGISDTQKEAFLQYAQDQLEIRIGEKMSEGLSDEQLDEFEKIIDNDPETINRWMSNYQNFKEDEIYKKLEQTLGGGEEELKSDYVTAKWLDQNCPQYQQIITESIDAIRGEITANKDQLLASMQ